VLERSEIRGTFFFVAYRKKRSRGYDVMRRPAEPWETTLLLASLKKHCGISCNGRSQSEKRAANRDKRGVPGNPVLSLGGFTTDAGCRGAAVGPCDAAIPAGGGTELLPYGGRLAGPRSRSAARGGRTSAPLQRPQALRLDDRSVRWN
jgi:hypothetical protein